MSSGSSCDARISSTATVIVQLGWIASTDEEVISSQRISDDSLSPYTLPLVPSSSGGVSVMCPHRHFLIKCPWFLQLRGSDIPSYGTHPNLITFLL